MDSEEFSTIHFGDLTITARRNPVGLDNIKKTVTFEIEKSLPNLEYEDAIRTAAVSVLMELILHLLNKEKLSNEEADIFQTVCDAYGLG